MGVRVRVCVKFLPTGVCSVCARVRALVLCVGRVLLRTLSVHVVCSGSVYVILNVQEQPVHIHRPTQLTNIFTYHVAEDTPTGSVEHK